ncbi:hypothetical protein [Pseudobutyrivibrio xylanivorans]|uniref:Uncharacterized protein n=1 Tax=Pseudobutyrivibrio xylanivorans DSM 14809 TaxID=1123012 RepID=A0A1M6IFA2_PSEXY|nr:hypothetical protein [Pseudobutyrivibrio xylanivorans]SHJ33119.1 hypothetical protein SAMN02745725_02301 [Pseudobutyrivibrio xylanivorans DSM 14809]
MNFKTNRLKRLYRQVISLAVAVAFVVPFNTNVANASELSTIHKPSSEKIFIPFRNEIPHYLSLNSSQQSEVVKMLWEKIFTEEAKWNANAEGFSSWVKKYDDYYSSNDGTLKLLSAGVQNSRITGSTGDFEAYFGNTIKNNPEFLGEIFGLSGEATNDAVKNAVCNQLSNPDKYKIFAEKIAVLTADKTYIGTGKGTIDNTLKNGSYKGISYDLYVLTTLASLYEGDGNESILSPEQVAWLKSYQQYLYNDYVTKGNSSLAKKYAPIYDLIARSTYAANNASGKGQEFFNYVVSTHKGVGAWLNMNNNINISGLDTFDDVSTIFSVADGWCCGRESENVCGNHQKCISNGTETERMAYLLYKNSTAMNFINGCTELNNLINDTNGEYGYATRYAAKHSGKNQSGKFRQAFSCGSGYYGKSETTRDYGESGNGDVIAYHTGTATFPIGRLALIDSAQYVYVDGIVSPDTGGWYTNRLVNWSVTVNGKPIATNENQSRVQATFTDEGLQFYISGLSDKERASAQINITAESYMNYGLNYPKGSPWRSFTSTAEVNIAGTVYLEGRYPDCITNGHSYTASEKNDTIIWSKDYSQVTFKPYCTKAASHKVTPITVKSEVTTEGNYLVYTAYCPYLDSTTTKRVSKTNGNTSETFALNSSNTSGVLYNSASGSERIWPAGSLSNATYKSAGTSLSATVLPGVIKSGTKSVTVDMEFADELSALVIQVLSSTGEELGRNAPNLVSNANDMGDCHYTNTFTVYLKTGVTDKDLKNCRMVISARAITRNWTPLKHPYAAIDDAFAYIKINSFTAQY